MQQVKDYIPLLISAFILVLIAPLMMATGNNNNTALGVAQCYELS